jgi:hypothetical protein
VAVSPPTGAMNSCAYKENKKPWDDCQACRFGHKAEIGQGLTVFILRGRPPKAGA